MEEPLSAPETLSKNEIFPAQPPETLKGSPATEENSTVVIRGGLLNLIFPMGLFTVGIATMFDLLGAIFTICDIAFGFGEILSWIIDDGIGGICMYFLLKNVGSLPSPSAIAERGQQLMKKGGQTTAQAVGKTGQVAQKASGAAAKASSFLARFGLCGLGKITPIVGGFIPFWTILTIWTYAKS